MSSLVCLKRGPIIEAEKSIPSQLRVGYISYFLFGSREGHPLLAKVRGQYLIRVALLAQGRVLSELSVVYVPHPANQGYQEISLASSVMGTIIYIYLFS